MNAVRGQNVRVVYGGLGCLSGDSRVLLGSLATRVGLAF